MRRREVFPLLIAAAAWPLAARAQSSGQIPVVGFLGSQSAGPSSANRVAGFLDGLSQAHYVVGQNVAVEYRWADGRYDRLPGLAQELVNLKVAVIAALTQDAALAAKAATSTIPIVFNVGGDPVATGLTASLNHPGGNATGTSMFSASLLPKRFGLLHETAPKASVVGVLINPNNANAGSQSKEIEDAAHSLGLRLAVGQAGTEAEIDATVAKLVQIGAQALLVAADPFLANRREQLVALAAKFALPAIYEWPDFVEAGGLMSYGTSIVDSYRQAGIYTGKILAGEKPADLPVMQPVKFDLAINLKTAKALGLAVPATLLAGADEVIE